MKSMGRISICTAILCLLPALTTQAQVKSHQKINDAEGGFTGSLSNSDAFGSAVTQLGDLNDDGVDDIAVGAPDDDGRGTSQGTVWVLFLNADGTVKAHQKITEGEGGFTATLEDFGDFGTAVASLGDLDGDDVPELAVGSDEERLWILFLKGDGTVKDHQQISAGEGGFTGVLDAGDFFGAALAGPGDLDEDGTPDLIVGANGDDDGGNAQGAVWVMFLNADGTVGSHQKISATTGDFSGILQEGDTFGFSVAALGDVDGDEITDIAIGAPGTDDFRGAVWVLFLDTDGTVKAEQKITENQAGFTETLDDDGQFGRAVTGPGDLDNHGVRDLAVGHPLADGDGTDRGVVWLLVLGTDGSVKTHHRISSGESGFTGELADDDRFGASITGTGDLDGDGRPDLVVGAPGDSAAGDGRGAVWILFRDVFSYLNAGLDGVSDPAAAWLDYDDSGDLDLVLSGYLDFEGSTRIYRNDEGSFRDVRADVAGIEEGSMAPGDYDSDGDLDLLLAGYGDGGDNIARIYENDGGIFSDLRAGLDGGRASSAAWGDYDNDGDLDILLTGYSSNGRATSIYRNDDGRFEREVGLMGVRHGTGIWGDYDNDGDLDILLTGCASAGCDERITRVYRNDEGSFIDAEAGLQGVWESAAAWGDYDSDGDLDILLTGVSGGEYYTLIYRNDDSEFTDIKAGLEGASGGAAAWGDYDNDGDLDILLMGETADAGVVTRIYRNDGGVFSELETGLVPVDRGDAAWGDYDGDGDLDLLLAGDAGGEAIARVIEALRAQPGCRLARSTSRETAPHPFVLPLPHSPPTISGYEGAPRDNGGVGNPMHQSQPERQETQERERGLCGQGSGALPGKPRLRGVGQLSGIKIAYCQRVSLNRRVEAHNGSSRAVVLH
jgi:hypothetical protein